MEKLDKKIVEAAKKVWDYHLLNHKIEKADCILVLGSRDLRVAKHGAKLFLDGYAPLIVFSGGAVNHGDLFRTNLKEADAERFAEVAIKMGVPANKVLIENRSANTGENILFSYNLLEKKGVEVKRIILVQKPYMERRTWATFKVPTWDLNSPSLSWRLQYCS